MFSGCNCSGRPVLNPLMGGTEWAWMGTGANGANGAAAKDERPGFHYDSPVMTPVNCHRVH